MNAPITLYDTTLRDGSQGEDVNFSVEDKLRIVERLDELGLDFIEGGWPGANPTDDDFFQQARSLHLKHSRLMAFGSTRRASAKVEQDVVLNSLLRAQPHGVTLFGKSWDLHVHHALNIPLEQNLELIHDSIRYMKSRIPTVMFDAEHYFDGFKANPEYALQVLRTAAEAGAEWLILCDTNGGCLVEQIRATVGVALASLQQWGLATPLGIHCHNDSGLAVASTLAAVEAGATQVQGTINGLGERCGNADLVTILPNLMLKMGRATTLDPQRLALLTGVSRFVNEMANRPSMKGQPFVGDSAFAHKGGVHVSAVLKDASTYEHIRPESVGNQQRVLISRQMGRSNLMFKLREYGIEELALSEEAVARLLEEVKNLEYRGYQFDGAEGSFELRVRRALGQVPEYFTLQGFRVIDERVEHMEGDPMLLSEASVKVRVGGALEHTAAEGTGPVNALDTALRKALVRFYPTLEELRLLDFKVRIVASGGTEAAVRVLVESGDEKSRWSTVGVSHNIIAASYEAVVDAAIFKLFKDGVRPPHG